MWRASSKESRRTKLTDFMPGKTPRWRRDIVKVIKNSSFEFVPGTFVYLKCNEPPKGGKHFAVMQDELETTVVTEKKNAARLRFKEKNKDEWKLIRLNVSIPFYCPGFLATASAAIADQGMNVLIVSTYSKDYLLVRADLTGKARKALLGAGFEEAK